MISIRLASNTISPDLARKARQVQRPRTLYEAGAKAVQRGIVTHLRALQARGNASGWPSQNFFARGRNSVEKNVGIASISDKGAVVTIADPRFLHRITGGTVTAKRRRFLAIPLRAEACALAGKGSIREAAPFLKVRRASGGRLFLVRELKDRSEFWFALVPSVTHKPRPEDQPDQAALEREGAQAMERAADVLLGVGR